MHDFKCWMKKNVQREQKKNVVSLKLFSPHRLYFIWRSINIIKLSKWLYLWASVAYRVGVMPKTLVSRLSPPWRSLLNIFLNCSKKRLYSLSQFRYLVWFYEYCILKYLFNVSNAAIWKAFPVFSKNRGLNVHNYTRRGKLHEADDS